MRRVLLVAVIVWALACPLTAPAPAAPLYLVDIPEDASQAIRTFYKHEEGRKALYIRVQFEVFRIGTNVRATDILKDEIVVREDGKKVASVDITVPTLQKLTTVLAIDTSGSMASAGKMEAAKKAAKTFLDKLDPRADVGLILFNHLVYSTQAPLGAASKDPQQMAEHREQLRRMIDAAGPKGGTAYLDATSEALKMLRGIKGRKAVLVLTDGQDMNSKATLEQVVAQAMGDTMIPVYTLGIGHPGKNEPVTTILVLDRSGSMAWPADGPGVGINPRKKLSFEGSKMEALQVAASRFVDLMRPNAQTTLLPFHNFTTGPGPFTSDKESLKRQIRSCKVNFVGNKPMGGTALYDATAKALDTLAVANLPGKKALVVLTDGRDEHSKMNSANSVIAKAQKFKLPLHTLGLGPKGNVDLGVLQRMASKTGGTYHHASEKKKLIEVFEKLSIKLHDDGIDEEALRKLAESTGGKYYPARDVSKLSFLYAQLADELQNTYTVTFRSRRSSHDGTTRGIQIQVKRNGEIVSEGGETAYSLHGVVPPGMALWAYLLPLGGLGILLIIPTGVRRLMKSFA